MNCQLCSGLLASYLQMPIDAKKDELTPFNNAVRCRECGTALIVPQPAANEVMGFYQLPKYYTHGESHISQVKPTFLDEILIKLSWLVDRPTPFDIDEMAKLLPAGGSICDIGCGDGALLKRFKDKGFEVLGVDLDTRAIEQAARSGVTVLPGFAESRRLKGQFDLVIMTHSLEHCIDPFTAISNAHACTKRGGYFYCEVPNCECLHFKTFTICSEMFDSPRHLWFFTATGLKRAIVKAGFLFDSWRFDGFTRHHSPGWRAWEMNIARNLTKRGFKGAKRHTLAQSFSLLAKSAFASAAKKYDCVGVLAKKAA